MINGEVSECMIPLLSVAIWSTRSHPSEEINHCERRRKIAGQDKPSPFKHHCRATSMAVLSVSYARRFYGRLPLDL